MEMAALLNAQFNQVILVLANKVKHLIVINVEMELLTSSMENNVIVDKILIKGVKLA